MNTDLREGIALLLIGGVPFLLLLATGTGGNGALDLIRFVGALVAIYGLVGIVRGILTEPGTAAQK